MEAPEQTDPMPTEETVSEQPTPEQIQAQRAYRDSVAKVEEMKHPVVTNQSPSAVNDTATQLTDSLQSEKNKELLGDFSSAAAGTEQFFTLENNLLKITLSSKGGRILRAELKNYKTYDKKPLYLLNGDNGYQ